MLLLSSYERLRRYISDEDGTALTDSTGLKRELNNWIASVSWEVENYLNRNLQISSRTEYFDVDFAQKEFWPKAIPISSITSVTEDFTGEWDGTGENTLSNYFIGSENDSVVLDGILPNTRLMQKALRIVYTGGLAYHGTRSTFTVTGASGTWGSSSFVGGVTSGALGLYVDSSSTSITIDTLYGIFQDGEQVFETDEDISTVGDAQATISALTQQCLTETYPDIVRAAEMEIRYRYKHKHDFETVGNARDATNLRRAGTQKNLPFQQEVISILEPYRRGLTVG